ncbi:hypothetical protein VSR01_02615 [Actinacidiphila sp. DG2A-62]|uniref:hypothetical protein n=1 Tax=Actinacidiphila sp. DG2A-62 TaxID=3108821 RepID=UPI002DB6A604|nr:hypothetical protein [Actinacidiphila sp. DG2A-62]MEC3992495.1 hypothetical protein [Actinacidiphila sp. DG2A-62]
MAENTDNVEPENETEAPEVEAHGESVLDLQGKDADGVAPVSGDCISLLSKASASA